MTTFDNTALYFITNHITKRTAYNILIVGTEHTATSAAFIIAFYIVCPFIQHESLFLPIDSATIKVCEGTGPTIQKTLS
jgi:hypothetical protein